MAHSVWSPDMQEFIEREGRGFDLVIFTPYLLGTTFWGMQVLPERSVLIPCLHDEPYAYMSCIRDMIEASAGCIFNTPAEERLAARLYAVPTERRCRGGIRPTIGRGISGIRCPSWTSLDGMSSMWET